MATHNPPSAPTDTPQGAPSQSVSSPNGFARANSAQPIVVPDALRNQLLHDVSARHAEYMAAVTAAHQSYLNLTAGLIGNGEGTVLSTTSEHVMPASDIAVMPVSAPSPSEPVTSNPLNGHSHLNGGTPAASSGIHAEQTSLDSSSRSTQSGMSAPTSKPTSAAAPVQDANNAMPSPSAGKSNVNGATEPGISTDLVRTLIAEKTGYPAEMIEDEMDLSGELGIDSIKQVEVLAALRLAVPAIKEVGSADMGQLRTIRQITDFFG